MFEDYQLGAVTDRAKEIYREKIKPLVEPQEKGKFIVIDVESGEAGPTLLPTAAELAIVPLTTFLGCGSPQKSPK